VPLAPCHNHIDHQCVLRLTIWDLFMRCVAYLMLLLLEVKICPTDAWETETPCQLNKYRQLNDPWIILLLLLSHFFCDYIIVVPVERRFFCDANMTWAVATLHCPASLVSVAILLLLVFSPYLESLSFIMVMFCFLLILPILHCHHTNIIPWCIYFLCWKSQESAQFG
jgi:hypothetical protein